MPVSALEKNPERKISAARIEKSKPSGASFNAGLNLVGSVAFYLEEKGVRGQARRFDKRVFQVRCKINSSTSLEPKKASTSIVKPARVRRTAVLLRHPSR